MKSFGFKLIAMFCLAFAPLVLATTVIPMSVEQLTRAASTVVEGRALHSYSQWNPQHSLIYTYTQFEVSRSLKGSAPRLVTVRQLGGSAGGYTQKVSGVHGWRNGEEAVLFLRPSEAGNGIMAVVGLMQGNYRIERSSIGERQASNGVPQRQVSAGASSGQAVAGPPNLRLEELERAVRKAVQP